jgi:hypothetical protein
MAAAAAMAAWPMWLRSGGVAMTSAWLMAASAILVGWRLMKAVIGVKMANQIGWLMKA